MLLPSHRRPFRVPISWTWIEAVASIGPSLRLRLWGHPTEID